MSEPERLTHAGAALSVWRDAPSYTGARTAALGAFSCQDVRSGADLLRRAGDYLGAEGFAAVLGPMDGDTWGAYRFVTHSDGQAPFLMEPQNPAHYVDAFAAAGFAPVAHYVSAQAWLTETADDIRGDDAEFQLRPFNAANAETDLRQMHALSLRAFASNPFYRPISERHFVSAYLPIVRLLDPELVLLAEDDDGALIGFVFGAPNHAEGEKPQTAILKTYASTRKGLGSCLARAFQRRARERGYQRVIHALMHENNISARHSEQLGAHVFRRYALYGRML